MKLSHDMCYQAIKAQDARFDGVFFTAVKTTGIYCRPICRVRAPKSENCTFYETAAQAEANGYRPCLRCRPELAPGYADVEQASELVSMAILYFEELKFVPKSVGLCADYLGVTSRHLTRIFQTTLGVSPQSYLMTKRLLTAKALLTDTQLPITEIALMVGFGSVSRFNAAFKKYYQLPPSKLRKENKASNLGSRSNQNVDAIKLKLAYRPPYNWDMMMQFYGMRTIPGVEWVTESGIYRRSIQIKQGNLTYSGWLEVKPIASDNVVAVTISKSLEKVLMIVIKRIRIAFDLDAMPDLLHPDLPSGIRLPGCFDAFEMATRAILGQQITVKAARTLAKRMVDLLGVLVVSPWEEINHHFPSAQLIAEIVEPISEVLGPIGVIKSRSNSILALASAIAKGDIKLQPGVKPEIVKEKLLALKGIGPWTAEYLTMRGLSWPDAFPVTDIGVKHGLAPLMLDEDGKLVMENQNDELQILSKHALNKRYEKYALEYAESYRPWRSYLTIALWHSLSDK